MKYLNFFALIFLPIFSFSQGPQIPVDVPFYYYNNLVSAQGWLYLPQDYATSTAKYPVVLFYPGTGAYTRQDLLGQSLPSLISNGMRPDNIINPVDGKSYSFIVLSCVLVEPDDIPAQLRWLQQNYRIDTSRIYVTGLSAGATKAMSAAALHDSISQKITAAVGMSTPPSGDALNTSLVSTYKIKTLQYSGSYDSYTPGAQSFQNAYNSAYPNSSQLTIFDGGHCCWETFYNVNYNDPSSGLSIWEWMLTNTKTTNSTLPVKFKSIKITKSK
jgi:predicted peptidase